MTVSATARLAFLPFASPSDPFPAGIWTSQMTLIGDASGGDAVITHEVFLLTEPFAALMLTIEQIFIDDNQSLARAWLLEAIGFEEHNRIGNNNYILRLSTEVGVGAQTGQVASGMIPKPIFLGRCDRTSGQASSISLRTANADGGSFRDSLFGYYWTPGAMNAPGGPQRPPGSLFGF